MDNLYKGDGNGILTSMTLKPSYWEDIKSVEFENLNKKDQNYLISLRDRDGGTFDLDNPYDRFQEQGHPSLPDQAIISDPDGNIYYMDTSGYDYPRYMVKIKNFPSIDPEVQKYEDYLSESKITKKQIERMVENVIQAKLNEKVNSLSESRKLSEGPEYKESRSPKKKHFLAEQYERLKK